MIARMAAAQTAGLKSISTFEPTRCQAFDSHLMNFPKSNPVWLHICGWMRDINFLMAVSIQIHPAKSPAILS